MTPLDPFLSTVLSIILIVCLVAVAVIAFIVGITRMYLPDDDMNSRLWQASIELDRRPRVPAPGDLT